MAMFLGVLWTASYPALGGEIELQSLKRSSTGFSGFSPVGADQLGDTINLVATDKGHEVHSVPERFPMALGRSMSR